MSNAKKNTTKSATTTKKSRKFADALALNTADLDKPVFGVVALTTRDGLPMFCEVMKFPRTLALPDDARKALEKHGFQWVGYPRSCYSRYSNPQSGFVSREFVKKFMDALEVKSYYKPTKAEDDAYMAQVRAYYATPEGVARHADFLARQEAKAEKKAAKAARKANKAAAETAAAPAPVKNTGKKPSKADVQALVASMNAMTETAKALIAALA